MVKSRIWTSGSLCSVQATAHHLTFRLFSWWPLKETSKGKHTMKLNRYFGSPSHLETHRVTYLYNLRCEFGIKISQTDHAYYKENKLIKLHLSEIWSDLKNMPKKKKKSPLTNIIVRGGQFFVLLLVFWCNSLMTLVQNLLFQRFFPLCYPILLITHSKLLGAMQNFCAFRGFIISARQSKFLF